MTGAVALLGILLAALLLAQQIWSLGGNRMLDGAISDALHVPWFAAVTLVLWRLLRRPRLPRLFLVAALVATVAEGVQLWTPREASVDDWLRNLVGTGAAMLLLGAFARPAPAWQRRFAVLALGVIVVGTLATPVRLWAANQQRDATFPLLVEPARWLTRPLWTSNAEVTRVTAPQDWPGYRNRRVVQVRWNPVRQPDVGLLEVVPDWRGYRTLTVDVYLLEPEPLQLAAVIPYKTGVTVGYDEHWLQPGPQRVHFALDRLAGSGDLSNVPALLLHVRPDRHGTRLLIGAIALE